MSHLHRVPHSHNADPNNVHTPPLYPHIDYSAAQPQASPPGGYATNNSGEFYQQPPPNNNTSSSGGYVGSQLFDDLSNNLGNPLLKIGVNQFMNATGVNQFTGGTTIADNLGGWQQTLKYYFNVNTWYVANKLKLLLFPLRHHTWKRRIIKEEGAGAEVYPAPREDINAPDLYIPTMAFVTYVLLCGLVMGLSKQFSPEVLGVIATTAFFVISTEVLFLKLGFYLLSNSFAVPFLDLVSYCGYIFVGIIVNLFIGIGLGRYPYYISMFSTSLFMSFFMVRTLRLLIPHSQMPTQMRQYFLLIVAALQIVISYSLGISV